MSKYVKNESAKKICDGFVVRQNPTMKADMDFGEPVVVQATAVAITSEDSVAVEAQASIVSMAEAVVVPQGDVKVVTVTEVQTDCIGDVKPVKVCHEEVAMEMPNVMNIYKAISKFSNFYKAAARDMGIYEKHQHLIVEGTAEHFYKFVGTCMFNSLLEFTGTVMEPGTPNVVAYPDLATFAPEDMDMLRFLDHIWNDPDISHAKTLDDLMEAHYDKYEDYVGGFWCGYFHDEEFFDALFVQGKTHGDKVKFRDVDAAQMIIVDLADIIHVNVECDCNDTAESDEVVQVAASIVSMDIESVAPLGHLKHDCDCGDCTCDEEGECGCGGHSDGDDEDDEDDIPNEDPGVRVNIFTQSDDYDIIRIAYEDEYGNVMIPMQIDSIQDMTVPDSMESTNSNLNGDWDWLANMAPDAMFTTPSPEQYITYGDPGENMVFIVLDESDPTAVLMGAYHFGGINVMKVQERDVVGIQFDFDSVLKAINAMCWESIDSTHVSQVERTVNYANENPDKIESDIVMFGLDPHFHDERLDQLKAYTPVDDENSEGFEPFTTGDFDYHADSPEEAAMKLAAMNVIMAGEEVHFEQEESMIEEEELTTEDEDGVEEGFDYGTPPPEEHVVSEAEKRLHEEVPDPSDDNGFVTPQRSNKYKSKKK